MLISQEVLRQLVKQVVKKNHSSRKSLVAGTLAQLYSQEVVSPHLRKTKDLTGLFRFIDGGANSKYPHY